MDSLVFLEKSRRLPVLPVYVVHGDELFLKRQVLTALRTHVLGADFEPLALSAYDGDRVSFSTVRNDLATVPFLSPRRLVIIDNADPFVTNERKKLEKYVAEPSPNGVLVLDVKSWTSTTNLAKLLQDATIVCKSLPPARLPEWCQKWALAEYQKTITPPAARLLVDLIGADMGMMDQELNKLSLYVGEAPKIENRDVDRLVGNSREEKTWKIFDLIAAGQTGAALAFLNRLFDQGEDVVKVLSGPFSWQLRKVVQAARVLQGGASMNEALGEVGLHPGAIPLLQNLGRHRLAQVFDWLIQTDLGVKGSSSLPPRLQLERLVVQLARPAPRHQARP